MRTESPFAIINPILLTIDMELEPPIELLTRACVPTATATAAYQLPVTHTHPRSFRKWIATIPHKFQNESVELGFVVVIRTTLIINVNAHATKKSFKLPAFISQIARRGGGLWLW